MKMSKCAIDSSQQRLSNLASNGLQIMMTGRETDLETGMELLLEAEKKEECQVIETSMLLKNKDTNKIKRRFATVESQ